jgi:eukaryotic-like serine/threonine-protein kinase
MSNNDTILNNRYRLVAQQGSGGMAVIYKAVDMELGRTVAIKILRPSLTDDPALLARFRNEARSVANLNHPNIVTLYDVGSEGPTQYIVMEFVDGQDLKRIIKTEGILPVDRALKIAVGICAGIGFAHRAGLVHADVKPQNILVTRDGIVKVTDFGIAQAFNAARPGERVSVVWGSPHYFAPEQARGEQPTPASDVYSIGIVMFEMLTGRLPYTGTNQQELALAHIREQIPLVNQLNPAVPETLAQIVYKVMSKDPAARYRMADQLGHVLEGYRDRGQQQTMASAAPMPRPAQPNFPQQPVYAPPPAQVPPLPPQYTAPPGQGLPFSQPNLPVQPQVPLPYSQPQPPMQPQYVQPPQPLPFTQAGAAQLDPTQRYGAPEAPNFGRQPTPGYNPPGPQSMQPDANTFQAPQSAPPWAAGNSQQMTLREPDRSTESDSGLDWVTIVLAILAFIAVLGLIPLWIAVYVARFAG